MKLLLIPILFISVSVSAQEGNKKQQPRQIDTAKLRKYYESKKDQKLKGNDQEFWSKNSTLGGSKKDYSPFKILNGVPQEQIVESDHLEKTFKKKIIPRRQGIN
jgi:hypothetical protein